MTGKQGPRDFAETAYGVFQQAVGDAAKVSAPEKSEAAVKRGNARSDKMSAERRSEIAKLAAQKRWAH